MQVIAVHLDRCTGCKTCELYCAVERGSSQKTLLKAVQESPLPQRFLAAAPFSRTVKFTGFASGATIQMNGDYLHKHL